MSRAQISFQAIGIGGVLKAYRLIVPANQRDYSWTTDQVTTLFQDFAKAIVDREPEYFLGTIVSIPVSPDELEVVDGQQRLATIAIFLGEIRNYLAGKEDLIVESITNGFLTDIDRDKRQRVAKMRLNLDDNEFFRAMITRKASDALPRPTRQSHVLIQEAFDEAREQVKGIVSILDQKDHGDALNKWIEFIEHSAQVILLRVPSDVNAYKMFETLNDRGLKTSQADLVKNYLFGESDSRLAEAQQKWTLMRGTLESSEEEDITVTFLRHSLIAIRGYLRENEVYEAVQNRAKGPQSAIEFLSILESLSSVYIAMFNPESEHWNTYPDTMRRAIKTLNLLNIKPMRSLMLAVAARFDPKEAAEAFRMFISWGVRLIIASSTRSGSVEEPMAAAAKKVFSGVSSTPGGSIQITTASELRKEVAGVIPGDEQFRKAFETATVSKVVLARYYLRSLEMAAKNESTPWFIPNDDQQVINLEHVLPERPLAKWPQFTVESHKIFYRRVGNLALLLAKSNSDLKSADFDTKKAIYKDSPYVLTSQIDGVAKWSEQEIEERQRTLAGFALKAWPL